jgi:hypothetical protein
VHAVEAAVFVWGNCTGARVRAAVVAGMLVRKGIISCRWHVEPALLLMLYVLVLLRHLCGCWERRSCGTVCSIWLCAALLVAVETQHAISAVLLLCSESTDAAAWLRGEWIRVWA